MFKSSGISYSPGRLCHLFTAKSLLAVTVMTAGVAKPGWVLAATWVTGELEGNFRTMMTSCWAWSVNIKGLCRRRYCWVDRQNPRKQREDTEREDTGEEEEDHVKTGCKSKCDVQSLVQLCLWLTCFACDTWHYNFFFQHWALNLGPPTC